VEPGRELNFSYRMYWGARPPVQPAVAEVATTRIGVGGVPGQKKTVPSRKFVLDFQGGRLDRLNQDARVDTIVTASRGEIRDAVARPIQESKLWRCHFDLVASGGEPVDLRCYLRDAGGALSETWLYQWLPPPPARG
jgi:glucans biosynthesis protein